MTDFVLMAWAKGYVKRQIAGITTGLKPKVVHSLPSKTSADPNVLYLVPVVESEENNYFEEYLLINNEWEKIATTKIPLDGYVTFTQLNAAIEEALTAAKDSGRFDGVGITKISIIEKPAD